MDPCPFVRLIVESLSLKLPLATKHAGSGIHPSTTPCFGKLKINSFPSQTSLIPLSDTSSLHSPASFPGFHLDQPTFHRFSNKPITLKVSVYTGRMGSSCGLASGKLLGSVTVSVTLNDAVLRPVVFQNGWMKLGSDLGNSSAKLHLIVRTEPDPRFVFQFGGEPECSPVVFQIQGNIRQPVFSCKFSADRNSRSRSLPSNFTTNTRVWMRTFSGDREKPGRERKGWMITIHDLSGSSVAAASMITPFVPSPGSDRVSRSNPGAWLILKPHGVSMKPWGRLEAWRERGPIDGLGYKFELVTSTGIASGIPIAQGTISLKNGGQFCIDTNSKDNNAASASSLFPDIRGFVMGSSVEGEGKVSKPVVQIGVKHVTCMTDAALFIALSAAIDLSMDACRLFSRKLRKEFWLNDHDTFSYN
ncbi:hypothetical protein DCAR_0830686 [Daucus carota subsp. sativus]|uniref:Formin-like protein 18 n=1 Tax=Daucus carota subsp. sativus TaxID=79200 RepID=A0AAF0XRB1_DAUCS|nr:PREDICTED: uncharacterized protein LOC108197259 [Daucus carota subsp. sativus]WOH11206.1 hypothetical protein DCAR_0830686 [Daucus carota subsp. sativus]